MEDQQQREKSRVAKVDSEESWDLFIDQANNQGSPGVPSKMEVKAMPTFVLMRDGAVTTKMVGANPEEIRKRISAFMYSLSTATTVE